MSVTQSELATDINGIGWPKNRGRRRLIPVPGIGLLWTAADDGDRALDGTIISFHVSPNSISLGDTVTIDREVVSNGQGDPLAWAQVTAKPSSGEPTVFPKALLDPLPVSSKNRWGSIGGTSPSRAHGFRWCVACTV